MWLDPAAASDVFRAMPPGVTHLVPLDATNDVPITPQYVHKLGADRRTVSARLVYKIMTQPAMTQGIDQGIYYWWDDLAAVSAFRDANGTIARSAACGWPSCSPVANPGARRWPRTGRRSRWRCLPTKPDLSRHSWTA